MLDMATDVAESRSNSSFKGLLATVSVNTKEPLAFGVRGLSRCTQDLIYGIIYYDFEHLFGLIRIILGCCVGYSVEVKESRSRKTSQKSDDNDSVIDS